MVRSRIGLAISAPRAGIGSTERRRSRTYPAVGDTTSPVLKVYSARSNCVWKRGFRPASVRLGPVGSAETGTKSGTKFQGQRKRRLAARRETCRAANVWCVSAMSRGQRGRLSGRTRRTRSGRGSLAGSKGSGPSRCRSAATRGGGGGVPGRGRLAHGSRRQCAGIDCASGSVPSVSVFSAVSRSRGGDPARRVAARPLRRRAGTRRDLARQHAHHAIQRGWARNLSASLNLVLGRRRSFQRRGNGCVTLMLPGVKIALVALVAPKPGTGQVFARRPQQDITGSWTNARLDLSWRRRQDAPRRRV